MRTIREVLNMVAHEIARHAELPFAEHGYDYSRAEAALYKACWHRAVDIYTILFKPETGWSDGLDAPFTEVTRLREALGHAAAIIDSGADAIESLDGDTDGECAQARDDAARFWRMSKGEPEPDEKERSKHYDAWIEADRVRTEAIFSRASQYKKIVEWWSKTKSSYDGKPITYEKVAKEALGVTGGILVDLAEEIRVDMTRIGFKHTAIGDDRTYAFVRDGG